MYNYKSNICNERTYYVVRVWFERKIRLQKNWFYKKLNEKQMKNETFTSSMCMIELIDWLYNWEFAKQSILSLLI